MAPDPADHGGGGSRLGRHRRCLQLHDTDLRAGNASFSLYSGPDHRGSGLVMEGLMAFCEWAFGNWPIRWLYAHSFEHNVGAFESGLRRGEAVRLGVLRERMVVGDELTDVDVIGIDASPGWPAHCAGASTHCARGSPDHLAGPLFRRGVL